MSKITILALHLGTGGAENVISNLSNILCENNEVNIISTYKLANTPAFYIDSRVKIEYLMTDIKPNREELKKAIKSKNIFKILKEGITSFRVLMLRKVLMIKAIKKCDSDIIISTRVLHNSWLGKYGKSDIIKIAQEHNHHNNDKKVIKKTIKSLKKIDYFMPVSQELYEFYKDKVNAKTIYIPNSLDFEPTKIATLENKNFIAVGRLAKEKGFADLIRIFSKLVGKDKTLNLRIVGDGEEKENLQNEIKSLKLEENVELCGFKSKKELDELYLDSSIYLMTSYTESFGLVLVEAESYGIPCVVFDSAQGAKEIIEDGINGFLIQNRNENEFIDKVQDLLLDKEKRIKMGEAGIEKSYKYRKENVAKEWNKFLEEIKN